MSVFVNRNDELERIQKAFSTLLSQDNLPDTRIIDFYGVEGIGKTSILQQVEQKCYEYSVPFIKTNANQPPTRLLEEIIQKANEQQTGTYDAHLFSQDEDKDLNERTIDAVRNLQSLLHGRPLVILLDAVDANDESQVTLLEAILDDVIAKSSGKLFVVLTSRRSIAFEHRYSVARRLEQVALLPLDKAGSQQYIDSQGYPMTPEEREMIYEWTRGYLLAIKVMIDAITQEGIKPSTEQGKQVLLTKLVERVIDHTILAQVEVSERDWFHRVLSLLSVPRRFNLIIMQNLIEHFEPELKLADSLAYIVLPKRIFQATGVMDWDSGKAGFAIDAPIRNIFLLQLRMQKPEQYFTINSFLADINRRTALKVSGTDRARYLLEYIYHSVHSADMSLDQLSKLLQDVVQYIVQEVETSPENVIQFQKNFEQDDELKELLGRHSDSFLAPLYREISQRMYNNALSEEEEEKRLRYFQAFFDYTLLNPGTKDLRNVLEENLGRLIENERPDLIKRFYARLEKDKLFKETLGADLLFLKKRIDEKVSDER